MPNLTCYPQSDPNVLYPYCPSYGAPILFACLFGLVTTTHIIQAIVHRKAFLWVLIMGGIWETAGYVFRILSVERQEDTSLFMAQLILVLLAPLWINAFVYMVLARMVRFYLGDNGSDKVFGIRARRLSMIFVLLDITAFIVQLAGGMLTSSSYPVDVQRDGFHIYMGGIGLQQFFICLFLGLAIRFQYKIRKQESTHEHEKSVSPQIIPFDNETNNPDPQSLRYPTYPSALKLLILLYLVLTLVTIRIVFRLVEFSGGASSTIASREWYSYVFDATMMLFALLAFNVYHPGRILRGANSDFSEDKKRSREAKRVKKEAKREAKEKKKEAKEATKAYAKQLK